MFIPGVVTRLALEMLPTSPLLEDFGASVRTGLFVGSTPFGRRRKMARAWSFIGQMDAICWTGNVPRRIRNFWLGVTSSVAVDRRGCVAETLYMGSMEG